MISNYASVKLSSEFVDEARREAAVLHRSLGAQVEYWARLGRAIEQAPGFSVQKARDALEGRLKLDGLGAAEQDVVLEEFGAAFDEPSPELRDHYAALGAAAGAVGADGRGRLVKRQTSGRLRRIA
jgi:hypothetical protein